MDRVVKGLQKIRRNWGKISYKRANQLAIRDACDEISVEIVNLLREMRRTENLAKDQVLGLMQGQMEAGERIRQLEDQLREQQRDHEQELMKSHESGELGQRGGSKVVEEERRGLERGDMRRRFRRDNDMTIKTYADAIQEPIRKSFVSIIVSKTEGVGPGELKQKLVQRLNVEVGAVKYIKETRGGKLLIGIKHEDQKRVLDDKIKDMGVHRGYIAGQ